MKLVWVVRFVEDPDMRVAATAEKAYEICKEFIEQEISLKALRDECLEELAEDYRENPEWFGCSEVCSAERIEVET